MLFLFDGEGVATSNEFLFHLGQQCLHLLLLVLLVDQRLFIGLQLALNLVFLLLLLLELVQKVGVGLNHYLRFSRLVVTRDTIVIDGRAHLGHIGVGRGRQELCRVNHGLTGRRCGIVSRD